MSKTALLIIDMLNDFLEPEGALYVGKSVSHIIPEIQKKLSTYRSDKKPVVFVCDSHEINDPEFDMFPAHCVKETRGSEVYKDLRPLPGEHIVRKKRFSSFFETDLEKHLRESGVDTLELTGVCTQICILYTCYDAITLGFKVVVDRRCVDSFEKSAHEFAIKEMERTLGAKII